MGIQINGQTDIISATDGSLTVSGADLGSASASSLNISGIVTTTTLSVTNIKHPSFGSNIFVLDSSGNINIDSGGVYYDNTNNRLGIGTETPTWRHEVYQNSSNASTGQYPAIVVNNPNASGYSAFYLFVGSTNKGGLEYNNSSNILKLGAASVLTFATNTTDTERARLDSSGRFLLGTSSAPTSGDPQYAKLVVSGNTASSTGDSFINITRNLAASSISSGSPIGAIFFTESSGGVYAQIQGVCDATGGTNDYPGRLSFYTTADGASSQTERLRIDSNGRLLVNSASSSGVDKLHIQLTDNNGLDGVKISGNTYNSSASGTYALRIGQNIDNNGNNSAALRIDHTNPLGGTGGALIQAFGNLGNSTAQCIWQVNGQGSQTINKANGDGTLIDFKSNNTSQGSISVSGVTVSYNAFLGSHWGRLEDGSKPDILIGTILETVNKLVDWKVAIFEIDGEEKIAAYNGESDVGETVEIEYKGKIYSAIVQYEEGIEPDIKKHVCLKVNDTPGSKAVFGVFLGWDEYVLNNMVTSWNDMYCAGVGNYFIRMAPGQTPQIGDLIESDGTGCGVVQSDDVIRSKTVAKINCNIPQKVYDDGSFLITCVLYCG